MTNDSRTNGHESTEGVPGAVLPEFEDARVQTVYEILCQVDENIPPDGEHWEGWTARRIVAATSPSACWQPIETAPADDWIIGYTSWGDGKWRHVGPCERIKDHFEFVNTDFDIFPRPTHWTPLPAPPETTP